MNDDGISSGVEFEFPAKFETDVGVMIGGLGMATKPVGFATDVMTGVRWYFVFAN